MEFVLMPLRHTPQGSLLNLRITSNPGPNIRTLVIPMLIPTPFPSKLVLTRPRACKGPTRWNVWVYDQMPFQIDKGHVQWRHRTFLVTDGQWIWRLWCCVQAWSQTECLRCILVVVECSQPPSLEPSWPGLAIWGLNKFFAQGRCPCPCKGTRWYSPPIQ